jgi:hypothetical protein
MRIAILFLLVSLLASECGFCSPEAEELQEEQGPYYWDFGEVAHGEIIEHTFVLKNNSLTPLEILHIDTSCGCTTSEVREKEIPPGGSVEIRVKFDTQGYSGIVKQHAYIHTDQQDNYFVTLTLKAYVLPGRSPD